MNIGLQVPEGVPVRLCGSLESRIFLVIGDGCEITLDPAHVRVLAEQCGTALRDTSLVAAAEEVLDEVYEAGAQARTAAERALREAERADEVSARDQADDARAAAREATVAAERAQNAVETAFVAMEGAERAAMKAEVAAAVAASAFERARTDR
ncbi:hypothetical protein [Saccharothrix sp.]|uniref:hypothetical protein n=1 Tax=Saccharothrix sp. TaxID=1873460 RepID=UPI002810FD58|nr:hypothetical protein [Saccharothrix sp.]